MSTLDLDTIVVGELSEPTLKRIIHFQGAGSLRMRQVVGNVGFHRPIDEISPEILSWFLGIPIVLRGIPRSLLEEYLDCLSSLDPPRPDEPWDPRRGFPEGVDEDLALKLINGKSH